jgi:SAM-dependent methyltransferase
VADSDELEEYFQLGWRYAKLYRRYRERGVVRELDPNDKELPDDGSDWQTRHYFSVGADAMRIVVASLMSNGREPPRTILDFPSGSGRVTRHLRAFFPEATIVACDLYDYHIEFCRRTFGAEALASREQINEMSFGRSFDLIFCGSLLTHLPEPLFRQTIDLLTRSLSETGIAIVTLQGRHSDFIQTNKWKYLDDQLYEIAATQVQNNGFGYVDYQHEFKNTFFDKQAQYGIALVRPKWVTAVLESRSDIRILSYNERYWDDHQDVLVFGRPGVNE